MVSMLNGCRTDVVSLYEWMQYGCRVCKCRVVDVVARKNCVCVDEVEQEVEVFVVSGAVRDEWVLVA